MAVKRYAVTIPVNLTIEIEAHNPVAALEVIKNAFSEENSTDPLTDTRIPLVGRLFVTDDEAVIKTAVLDPDGDSFSSFLT